MKVQIYGFNGRKSGGFGDFFLKGIEYNS